jgi:UDP-N-acetylmuramoyl-L-alanyl-D-glutamate--2,6-diaminopimelate ligase
MQELPIPPKKILSDFVHLILDSDIYGDINNEVTFVTDSSKACIQGTCFIALIGSQSDGHQYINDAINHGATTILCQQLPTEIKETVTYVVVPSTQKIRTELATWFFEYDPKYVQLVGVTGTNGKTSVSTFIVQVLRIIGNEAGLLSTIEYQLGQYQMPSVNTTPGLFSMYHFIYTLKQQGIRWCVLECSSHALHQGRLDGLQFIAAIFTNLTQDHLDYHQTIDAYASAKKLLFDRLQSDSLAIARKDDSWTGYMLRDSSARHITYSIHDSTADFFAESVIATLGHIEMTVHSTKYQIPVSGHFQAENILSVITLFESFGIDPNTISYALKSVIPPHGRMEHIGTYNKRDICLDYAHTPDALEQTIRSLRNLTHNRPLWVLVGCGGNRDTVKRSIMGRIATTESDYTILTSDNPRNEDPQEIINMMLAGISPEKLSQTVTILDRREAIMYALGNLPETGVLLLAGKGHETYQEIKSKKIPFDEKEIVTDWIGK